MMMILQRGLRLASQHFRAFSRRLPCGLQRCSLSSLEPPSISLDELAKRRKALVLELGRHASRMSDSPSRHVVLFPGSEIQYMAYHVPYRFHQDSNFLYFTGFFEANAILAMDISVQPSLTGNTEPQIDCLEYLFVEVRSHQAELWNGPTVGIEGAQEATGICKVYSLRDFQEFIKRLNPNTVLWYSSLTHKDTTSSPVPNRFVLSKVLRLRESHQIKIENPDILVDSLRYVKSPAEIRLLQHACLTTSQCLAKAMAASHPDITESTLGNLVEFESRSRGLALGYPPVVAGGLRANTIHYMKNDQPIRDHELVLVDLGCLYKGYTADITRTWPVNGHYTPAQRLLHDILEEVQRTCANAVSPERNLADIHRIMLTELARHLVSERIIPSTKALEAAEQICPHSVGHFLGLDVHDTPTVSHSNPFRPGVVFPLEPGIYMRPQLCDKYQIPKDFVGLGLRLEDDFVISPDGSAIRLTDQLPTSAEQLEALVGTDVNTDPVTHGARVNQAQS
ncbi:Xaa-Pro aminopeptidase 3 [Clonorchis sinensis]|uniref:Xaa-Pro aminopeptidase 3 n=2 Tax=Clonorchis sinensis TaxID=79923 RepID=A0A8T1MBH2_CLOSI|nr:Xaa-Pro aminopeptidase 3 [Clonorchis sinensis]